MTLLSECYDLRDGAALAGVLSGCAAGSLVAGTAFDLSTKLSLLVVACDSVAFLLKIRIASQMGVNILPLVIHGDFQFYYKYLFDRVSVYLQ